MADKKGSRSKVWRFFLITGVLFIAFLFIKKNNVVRWAQALFTLREQRQAIERYEQDIDSMDKQLKGLSTDKDTLETFARENFLFSKPEEDVYITGEKQ